VTIDRTGGVDRVPEPDPNTSPRWLLRAWREIQTCDPVDAANAAAYLADLCAQRADDVARREIRISDLRAVI
jgi:hypothetical protein